MERISASGAAKVEEPAASVWSMALSRISASSAVMRPPAANVCSRSIVHELSSVSCAPAGRTSLIKMPRSSSLSRSRRNLRLSESILPEPYPRSESKTICSVVSGSGELLSTKKRLRMRWAVLSKLGSEFPFLIVAVASLAVIESSHEKVVCCHDFSPIWRLGYILVRSRR